MTTNTRPNTCSATQSRIKLKLELENAFKLANSVDKVLEIFENMTSASCFKDSELVAYCWSLTHNFLQLDEFPNPQQVLTFGNKALTILTNEETDIGNIACFGWLSFKEKINNTRSHGPRLFAACVYHLLGTACYELKRYTESLRYLDSANTILSVLDENDDNRCLLNCVRQVLIASQQRQYNVMIAMGKKGMAIAQAREVLKFTELTMEGDSILLCDAYVYTYEAYVANLDAKRALPFCQKALEFCIRRHRVDSRVVAHLRVDLAVLYNVVGKFEEADQEWELSKSVLESTNDISDIPKAAVRSATLLFNLRKYKEVIDVLAVVVTCKGMKADGRVLAFLTMAKACCKLKKFVDAGNYMAKARRILEGNGVDASFVCTAYVDMSDIYKRMNELRTAISLLKGVWGMSVHHQKTRTGGRKLDYQNLLAASCTGLFELISRPGMAKEETLFMIYVAEKLEQIVGREHIEVGHGCAKFGFFLLKSDQADLADLALKVIKKAKDIMEVALGPQRVYPLRKAHHQSQISAKLGRIKEAAEFKAKAVGDIEGKGPSEKYFEDNDVRLLNNLRKIVAGSRTSALSQSQDSKDLSSKKPDCGTSRDGVCLA